MATREELLSRYQSLGTPEKELKPIMDNVPSWVPTADPILTSREPATYSGIDELGTGRLRKVAQGASFGFADEGEALLRSLITDENYDDSLYDVRSQLRAVEEKSPGDALALEVVGGMLTPGGWMKNIKGMSRLPATLTRPVEAGIEGGLYGFGSGEGGYEERKKDAKYSAALGSLIGFGTGAAEDVVSIGTKGFDWDAAADTADLKSIGIGNREVAKGMRKSGGRSQRAAKQGLGDPFVESALGAKKEGILEPGQGYSERVNVLENKKKEAYGLISGTVDEIDNAKPGPIQIYVPLEKQSLSGDLFPNTKKLIDKNRATTAGEKLGDTAFEEVRKVTDYINEQGSVQGVLDAKRQLYGIGYESGLVKGPEMERALSKDLKLLSERIVDGAEQKGIISGKSAQQFAEGNSQYGRFEELQKVYLDQLRKDHSDVYEDLLAQIRTSGGVGSLIVRGDVSPEAGALLSYLVRSEPGQDVLAPTYRGAGAVSRAVSPVVERARAGRVAGALLDEEQPGADPRAESASPTTFSKESLLEQYRALSVERETPDERPNPSSAPGDSSPELDAVLDSKKKEVTPVATNLPSKITDTLLDAVRKVESNDGEALLSPVGAKGPYQLMDDTGRRLHKRLKIKEPYDPFNEEQSRRIAKAHLEDGLSRFGTIELALADYNTGHNNLAAAVKQAGTKDWGSVKSVFKQVGNKETAAYVDLVKNALVTMKA